jgi:hypothetical protein
MARVRIFRVAALLSVTFAAPSLRTAHAAQGDDPADIVPPPDNGLPGPSIEYASRPAMLNATRACSKRTPVCVHAHAGVHGASVLGVLSAAENAWETLQGAFGLPTPDSDPEDLAYTVFIEQGANVMAETRVSARDVRSPIDRARSFVRLGAETLPARGCALDALVAQQIAHAFLFRSAPATAAAIATAETSYLAQLIAPCIDAQSMHHARTFQAMHERSVCDGDPARREEGVGPADPHAPGVTAFAQGASLFWSRIDWAYARNPGSLVTSSWALAPTHTAFGERRWHDEPDAFDVLRVSFKGALSTGSTLQDLWLDTAVARAFMGSSDDGLHQPETRALGDAAGIPFDWDIEWPHTPRRLAPHAPVDPTGASYINIRRANAAPRSRLRVEVAWEAHALFRWTLVKVDANGRELGRVPVPTTDRATEAQMTLVDLDNVDHVLLVGVNVGDPTYHFDPDDVIWEPHGWLVTLAEETP